MKRRTLFGSLPPVLLVAGAFGAGRVSTASPAAAPPCGPGALPAGAANANAGNAGNAGGDAAGPEAPSGPTATPRLVPPLPTPAADERAWLDAWLELAGRPAGTATPGC